MFKIKYSRCIKFTLMLAVGVVLSSCDFSSTPTPAGSEPQNITDVTADASLTVNHENPGGPGANEGSQKLIDGDKYTKFLVFDYSSDYWAQQEFDQAVQVNAYTVTAGNDAPERDPKNWTLEGSNDGSSWETIDTQTDAIFDVRNKTNIYHLDSDVNYKYYRYSVTEDYGSTLMQISEWRLLYYGEGSESSK